MDTRKKVGCVFFIIGVMLLLVLAVLLVLHITYGLGVLLGFGVMSGVIGFVFVILGGKLIKIVNKESNNERTLRATGRLVKAEFVDTIRGTGVIINGVVPIKIRCKYVEDGKIYEFRSQDLWENPAPFLGETVDVYVDPTDMKKHFVDVYSYKSS